jgi:hypothetical protein
MPKKKKTKSLIDYLTPPPDPSRPKLKTVVKAKKAARKAAKRRAKKK